MQMSGYPPALDSERVCREWLETAARTRDLAAPLRGSEEAHAATRAFAASIQSEMLAYRQIAEAATAIAALDAEQLRGIVASALEQSAAADRTAAAIAEVDRAAAHVAQTTQGLRELTETLRVSADAYDSGIDSVLAALGDLVATVETSAQYAISMERGSIDILAFLELLRRVARQARLLAINAAIEAAHLGEAGSGFVIVAGEVRSLADSTGESASAIADIEKDLHRSSLEVEASIATSAASVRELRNELLAARERSSQTREQVRDMDAAIADVAAIAGQQSSSVSAILHAVAQAAQIGNDTAAAAERASALGIGDALDRLIGAIARYRLDVDVQTMHIEDVEMLPESLREAAAHLRSRADADQLEILGHITAIAVSIARNSYEWRAIGIALARLQVELRTTTIAIDETAEGAGVAARAAGVMRTTLDALRAGFAASIAELDGTLAKIGDVRNDVLAVEKHIADTADAGRRAAAIIDIIDTISGETNLLSFNAAIEAAHAGAAGSSFGVIADEIRVLANNASEATQHIASVIGGVDDAGHSMIAATAQAFAQTDRVQLETASMRSSIGELRVQLEQTLSRSAEVAGIVEQQLAALVDVRSATELAAQRVASDVGAATDGRRVELAMLGVRSHALAARRPLGTLAEKIREIGHDVAGRMDGVFRSAIEGGAIRLEDCFDTAYQEIKGASIRDLSRLFDVTRVPESGFDPAKFATAYDRAVESGIDALIDEYVPRESAIKAMFAVDLNGFCFGHYRECRQDWTGDYATDLNNNRIKRFFDDDLSLRCARVGLGAASDRFGKRTPHVEFEEAGCTLTRRDARPWAIFTYARDTGIVYNDLSVALFAGDHRVGTIRIIYDADRV
jgi:methyl-accepting chemotaxis protein